jgi:hypothetical protein
LRVGRVELQRHPERRFDGAFDPGMLERREFAREMNGRLGRLDGSFDYGGRCYGKKNAENTHIVTGKNFGNECVA